MVAATTFSHISNNTAPKWWNDPSLRKNVWHCIALCFCPYYLGFDASLLTGLQSLRQWQAFFDRPTGNKLGLISASLFLPAIISCILADWMSDRYGRKATVMVGSAFIFFGAFINAFATNLAMYVAGRTIIGWGGGMTKVAAPALLQEISHPRYRAVLAAVYYTFYYLGSVVSAWLTFGTLHIAGDWSWRFPSLFQIIGPIVVCAALLNMPESPRWLVKSGQSEKALDLLAKFHANGDKQDDLVQYEYKEITMAIELEETHAQVSYLDFFRTPGNRHRLFVLVFIGLTTNWIGNGIISYYLSPVLRSIGITDPAQQVGINGGLQIFNLFAALGGASLVERVGRRPLWLTSVSGMLACYIIIMALAATFAQHGNKAAGTAVVPFLYIFYGFYDIGWTPLSYSYSSEIMPFHMRTKGLAVLVFAQNIGNAFNQFVNPIALAKITWKYYAVYIVIQVCTIFVFYQFFPETKGRSLEEVSTIFDSKTENSKRLQEEGLAATHTTGEKGEKGEDGSHHEKVSV